MLRLYLLRHAKSAWDDPGLDDHDRPLNARGRTAAALMGRHMAGLIACGDMDRPTVICSSARRARETWKRVARAGTLDWPVLEEPALYMAGTGSLVGILKALPTELSSVMLVGHNPGMQDLALLLAGSGPQAMRARLQRKLPTGSLLEIGFNLDRFARIAPSSGRLIRFDRPKGLMADTGLSTSCDD